MHILNILHILFIVGAGLLLDPVNMRRIWRSIRFNIPSVPATGSVISSRKSNSDGSRLMTCCRRRRCQTNLGPSSVTKSRPALVGASSGGSQNGMESLDRSAGAWKGGRWCRCGGPSRWNHLGVHLESRPVVCTKYIPVYTSIYHAIVWYDINQHKPVCSRYMLFTPSMYQVHTISSSVYQYVRST